MNFYDKSPIFFLYFLEKNNGTALFAITKGRQDEVTVPQRVAFNRERYQIEYIPPITDFIHCLTDNEKKLKKILSTASRIDDPEDIVFPFLFHHNDISRELPKEAVEVYTDASVSSAKMGGWAGIVVMPNSNNLFISGRESSNSNNRMELLAVVRTLDELDRMFSNGRNNLEIFKDWPVLLHTDSKYVIRGIEVWLNNWRFNGFTTAMNRPVKNMDLWKEIDKYINKKDIYPTWLPSRSGNSFHRICDETARKESVK